MYKRLLVMLMASFATPAHTQGTEGWLEPFMDPRRSAYMPPPTRTEMRYVLPWELQRRPAPRYDVPYDEPRVSAPREPMPEDIGYKGKLILVLIDSQQYSAYVSGRLAYHPETKTYLRGPVSTGGLHKEPRLRWDYYFTPLTNPATGPQKIDIRPGDHKYKSRTHPKPDGGASMPFSMFIDRANGIALHQGYVPRWNGRAYGASKGCIRLPGNHARIMFYDFSGPDVDVIIAKNMQHFREVWEKREISAR